MQQAVCVRAGRGLPVERARASRPRSRASASMRPETRRARSMPRLPRSIRSRDVDGGCAGKRADERHDAASPVLDRGGRGVPRGCAARGRPNTCDDGPMGLASALRRRRHARSVESWPRDRRPRGRSAASTGWRTATSLAVHAHRDAASCPRGAVPATWPNETSYGAGALRAGGERWSRRCPSIRGGASRSARRRRTGRSPRAAARSSVISSCATRWTSSAVTASSAGEHLCRVRVRVLEHLAAQPEHVHPLRATRARGRSVPSRTRVAFSSSSAGTGSVGDLAELADDRLDRLVDALDVDAGLGEQRARVACSPGSSRARSTRGRAARAPR